ncbi:MAG: ImmA/IrrE family metallo-endopeptidase [Oscillospiraceae bacterium]|nr:ImmA/IrrE family metallo-endopeptidase [Oscillospiraceae bacterium]
MNAVKALLDAGISRLPVDLEQVAEFYSIRIVDYPACAEYLGMSVEQLYSSISPYGFSFCDEGEFVCAVNGNACGKSRRRWTLAHELAHILLGHIENSGTAPLSEVCEREADCFAAELLAPMDVLQFCAVSSPQEIARLCGLSLQAAQYRYEELLALRRCHHAMMRDSLRGIEGAAVFLADDDRMRLYMQLLPFVAEYISERTRHDGYAEYLRRTGTERMSIE